MSRFLSEGQRFFRRGSNFVGIGRPLETPLETNYRPEDFQGALAYANDGLMRYSDGTAWIIPTDDAVILRPAALEPTNATQQSQLRLTPYRSPDGAVQAAVQFQIAQNGSFENALERTVEGENETLYQVLYPEDGFEPGDEITWRGRHLGDGGEQSEWSLPFTQFFPELITRPEPVTRRNAVAGAVRATDYESPEVFDLSYVETQTEFYDEDATVGADAPVATVTHTDGALTEMTDPPLESDRRYLWRSRYVGQANFASEDVISEWSPDRPVFLGAGSIVLEFDVTLATDRTVRVPLGSVDEPVDVTVDWGDGTEETFDTPGVKEHTYDEGFEGDDGRVLVTISGQLDWYGTASSIDQSGLVRVENIGFQMGLRSLQGAFRGTREHLISMPSDIPLEISNMADIFRDSEFDQPIGSWDVSNVTTLANAFRDSQFNQPLEAWDVSNVTTLNGTFRDSSFNQPLETWDVSNVTTMRDTFRGSPFNQPLEAWDVSNVTTIQGAFLASSFNQPLEAWDVSNVTNMRGTFDNSPFNQPLETWDVSNVTTMRSMFSGSAFNQPIGSWDVSNVTTMQSMFNYTNGDHPFDQDISGWDVSNVINMSSMFYGRGSGTNQFNQDISGWDVSSVENMEFIFSSGLLDQDLGAWPLNTEGVDFREEEFSGLSTENWSRTLIGWAHGIAERDGPYGVEIGLDGLEYDANSYAPGERFENAVQARAFLIGERAVEVTDASVSDANGSYSYNDDLQTYDAENGWYFAISGSGWSLFDANDEPQAETVEGEIGSGPQRVTEWDGVLAGGSVLRTGAEWSISGDEQV